MKLAVQLYTLRHHMENGEDFFKILEKVKSLDFDGVEFAGFYGYKPEKIKAKLDELNLTAVGAHMGLEDFTESNIDNTINLAKTLGMHTIGVGGADTKTETALERVINIMGQAYKKAKKEEIKVYFHNHTGEFLEPIFATEPGTIFDRIKKACDIQLDCYWSYFAGMNNSLLIAENRKRIVNLHIKDGIDGKTKALGEGNNDLTAVIRTALRVGIEWLIVENDDPEPNGIADITRSMKWLCHNL